jgi:hypothetical protein
MPGKVTMASQRSAKAKGKGPDVAQPTVAVSHPHRALPPLSSFPPLLLAMRTSQRSAKAKGKETDVA